MRVQPTFSALADSFDILRGFGLPKFGSLRHSLGMIVIGADVVEAYFAKRAGYRGIQAARSVASGRCPADSVQSRAPPSLRGAQRRSNPACAHRLVVSNCGITAKQ